MANSITSSDFGQTRDGRAVEHFKLSNPNGVEVGITNYGGIITCFKVPDKTGTVEDIVLGYDTLAQYEACEISMGCIVGRYANRIANGRFHLDGRDYSLDINSNGHHLHGGFSGLGKALWRAAIEPVSPSDIQYNDAAQSDDADNVSYQLVLCHLCKDGEGGYPGAISIQVRFFLSQTNALHIDYSATTDKPTVVNLTSHSYFNLSGHQRAQENGVLEHQLCIPAGLYIPTDAKGIPLGRYLPVADSPMDFTTSRAIGGRIGDEHPQLEAGSGYDHTWVFDSDSPADLKHAARLVDPDGKRTLDVFTTQPGMQFYTANHVHACAGKQAAVYGRRGAVCLETQHFPDAPNQATYPSTVLRPGEHFNQTSIYKMDS